MSLFEYFAINEKGKKIKGIIEAESEKEAAFHLQNKSIVITHLHLFCREKKTNLSKKDILGFTEELSKLLSAGLPLYYALSALKDKYENHKLSSLILDLADQIKRGKNFSQALERYPQHFDLIYCSMVANAEKSGTLIETLQELTIIMERAQGLKKKLSGALLYPTILSLFCFVVIFTLVFFVVPSLSDLFEGKNLHPLTKFVLAISRIATSIKGYLSVVIILLIILVFLGFYLKKIRKILMKTILKAPLIKPLMIKVCLIRFCRSFSVLLSTGISYVEAIKLSKAVMNHPVLEKDVHYAEEKIIQGEKLSHSLKEKGNIPILMIRMLELSEESGKTAEMLSHISKIYEDELEKSLTRLTTILQPLLLLFLGIIVGIIVLSVLLPLTDVSSFVG